MSHSKLVAAWLSPKHHARARQAENPQPHEFYTSAHHEAHLAHVAKEKAEAEQNAAAEKADVGTLSEKPEAADIAPVVGATSSAMVPSAEVRRAINKFESAAPQPGPFN